MQLLLALLLLMPLLLLVQGWGGPAPRMCTSQSQSRGREGMALEIESGERVDGTHVFPDREHRTFFERHTKIRAQLGEKKWAPKLGGNIANLYRHVSPTSPQYPPGLPLIRGKRITHARVIRTQSWRELQNPSVSETWKTEGRLRTYIVKPPKTRGPSAPMLLSRSRAHLGLPSPVPHTRNLDRRSEKTPLRESARRMRQKLRAVHTTRDSRAGRQACVVSDSLAVPDVSAPSDVAHGWKTISTTVREKSELKALAHRKCSSTDL
ncbi:hypothetical protein DFH11DRAFT_1547950 [Phellopilus nigrolimitatus]|nr:hypothetical protein DFH11DRAFT_1547950 [Phellopilus nigrolimitatus]